jgi:hypothetical protein
VSDEVLVGAAVLEGGWFGGAFAWAVERDGGAVLAEASAAGLPRIQGAVGDRPATGARASWDGGGLSIAIERRSDRYRLTVNCAGLAVDARLDARGAPEPFTLVAPVPGAGPRVTQKCGGLPAEGTVHAAGRPRSLTGGTAGVDFTAGLLAHETAWRWAFATPSGRTAGRAAGGGPVAFNLCEGFGLAPDDPGENALLVPGPARLPPVTFSFERAAPLAPWTVASADGSLSLEFRPIAEHREERERGLLSTRFVQIAGTFHGTLPGPSGRPMFVDGLPGVVEDHHARW